MKNRKCILTNFVMILILFYQWYIDFKLLEIILRVISSINTLSYQRFHAYNCGSSFKIMQFCRTLKHVMIFTFLQSLKSLLFTFVLVKEYYRWVVHKINKSFDKPTLIYRCSLLNVFLSFPSKSPLVVGCWTSMEFTLASSSF